MKITFEEQLQKDLAKILCTRKSLVEIGGVVNEDDCTVVQCKVGISKYMVVLKDGFLPQVYRRI